MFAKTEILDKCLECNREVNPKHDRQELAWTNDGKVCYRRCGVCIEQRKKAE